MQNCTSTALFELKFCLHDLELGNSFLCTLCLSWYCFSLYKYKESPFTVVNLKQGSIDANWPVNTQSCILVLHCGMKSWVHDISSHHHLYSFCEWPIALVKYIPRLFFTNIHEDCCLNFDLSSFVLGSFIVSWLLILSCLNSMVLLHFIT